MISQGIRITTTIRAAKEDMVVILNMVNRATTSMPKDITAIIKVAIIKIIVCTFLVIKSRSAVAAEAIERHLPVHQSIC
jgi:hypothetical protein